MSASLDNKLALVTGGDGGIGKAIVQRLASAGATVIVGDLAPPPADDPCRYQLDVTCESSVTALMESIKARYGRLDILVNNAGIVFQKTLSEQAVSDWDQMMAVNLKGPFLMSKHALGLMVASGGGSIVNIGSIEGESPNPQHTAYAASKAGVHGLTRALAIDLGPKKIRCNAIAPGWIDTELNAAYMAAHPDRELIVSELTTLHPVGRIGTPMDIADAVLWLASDASQFVTGQTLRIDGGRSVKLPLPSILAS